MKALVDTSVLVSDLLWLGLVTMRRLATRTAGDVTLELYDTSAIQGELFPALRRVYRQRSRAQNQQAFGARVRTMTHLDMSDMKLERRGFVKDPDDAHLDVVAWQGGMDVLVTNDVRAFKPVSSYLDEKDERGYVLMSGDALLVELWDALAEVCRAEFVDTWRELYEQYCAQCELEVDRRPVSEQFRRARAFKLAKRLKRLG